MRPWNYNIEGEGDEALKHALNYIATCDYGGIKKFSVTHYDICMIKRGQYGGYEKDEKGKQTLFMGRKASSDSGTVTDLAFPHDIEATYDFARRWLKQAHFGPQPDTDGSCNEGWRLFEAPSIGGSACYADIALQPCWIIYGK